MMFFSKFCRKNANLNSDERRRRNFVENSNSSNSSSNRSLTTAEVAAAARPRLSSPSFCETNSAAGLPNYNRLPATPPPSYSPREKPEQLGVPRENLTREGCEERRRIDDSNRPPAAAVLPILAGSNRNECKSAALPPQNNRIRRQCITGSNSSSRNSRNSNSNSNSSSSDEDSSDENNFHRGPYTGTSNPTRINDVYCPDLLNACSLILTSQRQQQTESDSSASARNNHDHSKTVGQQLVLDYSSDYAEIDEIRLDPVVGARRRAEDAFVLLSQSQAKSTPELNRVSATTACRFATNVGSCLGDSRRVHDDDDGKGNDDQDEDPEPSKLDDHPQAMGQNLSLRRPRISLTWVLREQQQQQQQQQPPQSNQQSNNLPNGHSQPITNGSTQTQTQQTNNNGFSNGDASKRHSLEAATTKKKYKIKQNGHNGDKCNAPAPATNVQVTSPTSGQAPLSEKHVCGQVLQDHQNKCDPSKDLLFVCTPQRQPKSFVIADSSESLVLAKRRHEIKKKFVTKMATTLSSSRNGDGAATLCTGRHAAGEKEELKSLKGTYSEPSLIAASEGNHRRHRHRKRRERNRVQKFGYEIRNVDEFLSKCSLASPGNIPVVLSTSSTLYQTRPGGYQIEIPLPLGMVVNAVFKNQNWLYVQTPHAEEGYVGYSSCLPLGILPPSARSNSSTSKPPPCWETNGDVFPQPCGNMTDSEKEMRLRGGTRSDGARTPRGRRANGTSASNVATDKTATTGTCEEHHVDKLYLRAASQPKLTEKAYAQLKSTKATTVVIESSCNSSMRHNDEYVVLQQQHRTKLAQKHQLYQQQQQQQHQCSTNPALAIANVNGNCHTNTIATTNVHHVNFGKSLRQTLVAINSDYATESIVVHKGEIVTLCECRESKDHRQWFYVKTRDGREGYIPAEVAGHGFL